MAPHVPVRQQPENFLQKTFNTISLQRDEQLWLSTDDHLTESRLRLLAEFPETQFNSQFKLDCVSNAKNGKLSSALREKGNLSYAQGDCDSALRLYNQSIEFAPTSSCEDEEEEAGKNDLALAFANRSAVWNDRCEYALALRDADLAFEANYPEGLQHKLYERKGQCLAALAKVEEAKDMLNKAIEALDKSNLKGERKKAKEKTLQKLIADLQVQETTVATNTTPKAKHSVSF